MIGLKKFFKYFWKIIKKRKKILFCFLGIIVVLLVLLSLIINSSPDNDFFVEELGFDYFIMMFFGSILFVMLPMLPIIGIILGYRMAKFRQEIDKLSYSDLKNKKEYYREFLENYSPIMLGYIDNFEIGEKDVIAAILNLEKKKRITISDTKISVISEDKNLLDASEKCVLEAIKSKSLNVSKLIETLNPIVKNEAREKGLTCEKKLRRRGILKGLIRGTLVLLGMFAVLVGISWTFEGIGWLFDIDRDILENIFSIIFGIPAIIALEIALMYPIAVLTYCIVAYVQTFYAKNEYRTEKAEKINENIEGLKNFLKDFSLLDKRQKEDVKLWDRYLIYSVMFGQNKGIVKDFEKYYTSKGEKND
ncbi:MAG: DUF2207 domain-containing protein [Clostridia bacterium]|nr:DUF2207 domain-containing protein [Clostridia bacterium]